MENEEEVEKEEPRKRKESGLRKKTREFGDNFKRLLKDGLKKFWKALPLKVKLIISLVLVFILLVAIFVLELTGSAANIAKKTADSYYSSQDNEAAKLYKTTGSFLLSSDEDITNISNQFLTELKLTNESFYNILNKKVKSNDSATVASNISSISVSSQYEPTDEELLVKTTPGGIAKKLNGSAKITTEKSLYEHILKTEKYNFNNIIWREYRKQNGAEVMVADGYSKQPAMIVDTSSHLQYPKADADDQKKDEHNLDFFVKKLRSYLQISDIPFIMATGTQGEGKSDMGVFNSNFALEMISKAYHEIVVEKHRLETLTRTNKYKIYDEKVTEKRVIRTCTTYEREKPLIGNGPIVVGPTVPNIGDKERITVCTDTTKDVVVSNTKNKRENISSNDNTVADYNYMVSSVKTYDNSFNNTYDFTAYYVDNNRYYEDLGKTDYNESKSEEYHDTKVETKKVPKNTNVKPIGFDEKQWSVVGGSVNTYVKQITTQKDGLSYTDILKWLDKLKLDKTQTGKYSIKNITDYATTSLNEEENKYYSYYSQKSMLNLVDLLNSKDINYKNYLGETDNYSENIGYHRDYLDISYTQLKGRFLELMDLYPGVLAYGSSMGIKIVNRSSYDYSYLANGQFGWPVPANYYATDLYGNTKFYYEGTKAHMGIDIGPGSLGANPVDVVTAKSGTVTISRDLKIPSDNVADGGGWGNYIKIDHEDGTHTLYAHLETGTFQVVAGQHIEAGQVIALMGSSGDSTGKHLHFEVYSGGDASSNRIDPLYCYPTKPNPNYYVALPEYLDLTENDKLTLISESRPYMYSPPRRTGRTVREKILYEKKRN